MPDVVLRIAGEFSSSLADIYSEALLARIRRVLGQLTAFPDMGTPVVRRSLVMQYGPDIRTVTVAPYVVVYRHDGGTLDVLGLVYGRAIR